MSSWDISYIFGEYSNQSYVSDSVFEPGVERGEEVVFVVRCDDGRVLPDLNEEFVDEAEPSYVAQSNPQYSYETYQSYLQYAYGSYHSHVEQQHMNENEEGANDHEEPNPGVSFETHTRQRRTQNGNILKSVMGPTIPFPHSTHGSPIGFDGDTLFCNTACHHHPLFLSLSALLHNQ
ncbi:hypothetical protein L1987_49562 [Smallanthus sonchifolius]|uniref:Uncharacterized protein n=1 Tax=Smallanthus sonchifolius TaxID=185202 RepID=A0ACB9FW21_9ASTR|nr:hypothetical protein L1987_49562 [Smallanthus sonchifolius]